MWKEFSHFPLNAGNKFATYSMAAGKTLKLIDRTDLHHVLPVLLYVTTWTRT